MKKILAIFLLLMLVTASAYAAEWEQGLSPAKPYIDQPEVNLDETIGYMLFYPNARAKEEEHRNAAGKKTLFIYLPRTDVVAIDNGSLVFRSSDRGEEWRVKLNDTNYVNKRDMVESELYGLLWGSGVCFEITLPVSPRLGASYTVNLEPKCIVNSTGRIANPAITDVWNFSAYGDFSVNELEYRRPKGNGNYENGIGKVQPGDEIRFDLVLGGDAYFASIYVMDNANGEHTAKFDNDFYKKSDTESGAAETIEVIGTALSDDPYWGVMFLDMQGNVIGQQVF